MENEMPSRARNSAPSLAIVMARSRTFKSDFGDSSAYQNLGLPCGSHFAIVCVANDKPSASLRHLYDGYPVDAELNSLGAATITIPSRSARLSSRRSQNVHVSSVWTRWWVRSPIGC